MTHTLPTTCRDFMRKTAAAALCGGTAASAGAGLSRGTKARRPVAAVVTAYEPGLARRRPPRQDPRRLEAGRRARPGAQARVDVCRPVPGARIWPATMRKKHNVPIFDTIERA